MARNLTSDAWRTHVEALIWSNARGLDLIVPTCDVRRFAETRADLDRVIAELLDTGWWTELPTAFDIGTAEEGRTRGWQPTADQVIKHRSDSRERVRNWRKRNADPQRNRETELLSISALPNPTQPNPVPNALRNALPDLEVR
jgi:hypothetical protein